MELNSEPIAAAKFPLNQTFINLSVEDIIKNKENKIVVTKINSYGFDKFKNLKKKLVTGKFKSFTGSFKLARNGITEPIANISIIPVININDICRKICICCTEVI